MYKVSISKSNLLYRQVIYWYMHISTVTAARICFGAKVVRVAFEVLFSILQTSSVKRKLTIRFGNFSTNVVKCITGFMVFFSAVKKIAWVPALPYVL